MVRFLGQSGLNVVTLMMGLILAVIGVRMLIEGIARLHEMEFDDEKASAGVADHA